MAKGRPLPTRVYDIPRDSFDNHLVTALDPTTPRLARIAMSPGDGGLQFWVAATAAFAAGMAVGVATGVAGAGFGVGAGLFVAYIGIRETIIARSGGRKRWVTTIEAWSPSDERFPETVALAEALQSRRTIRDVARGDVGHHISDELLDTIETVIYEASNTWTRYRAAERTADRLIGDGAHAAARREECHQTLDLEYDRLCRYRDALSTLAAAAFAADAEYKALAAAGYTELGARDDLIEAQLTERLATAAADLRAVAEAAAEINAAAGDGHTATMAEVAATQAAIDAAAVGLTATAQP